MTRRTAVPSSDEENSTSSTRARINGMPNPRSNFSRSGSVTGGCSGRLDTSNPVPRSSMRTSRWLSSAQHSTITRSSVSRASWASMAFVHASETAIFRSSTRSSESCVSAAAIADTTSLASATNSAPAGISSWTARSVTAVLRGDGVFDRVVDREDFREPGDFEHFEDAALGAHEQKVAVVATQALQPTHEHAQTGGIEEIDALEVDDNSVLALAHEFD